MKYKIVIWGYGRFGALLHQILSDKFESYLNQKLQTSHDLQLDENVSAEIAEQKKINNAYQRKQVELVVVSSRKLDGVKQQSLSEAIVGADMLIPTMPISQFAESMDQLVSLADLNPDLIVLDVCSVKLHPAEVMRTKLPKTWGIVATHPMWGPDSTEAGTKLADLKFIYKILRHNGSVLIDVFINFWSDLGQEVIEMTPDEHDRQAAYTHAFAFLIGKIGINMSVRQNQISTKGFNGILYNQTAVENDSGDLFTDMFTYNDYAREMLTRFKQALGNIEEQLDKQTKLSK
jgi:prephenate dehydrogenase